MAIRGAELNRRVQVTATKSWGPTLTESVRIEVDSQVAAPTETRTPNLHRANIAHQRVRMEGWRQRRPGSQEDHSTIKGNCKTDLTLTGLLMEGLGSMARHALIIPKIETDHIESTLQLSSFKEIGGKNLQCVH